MARIETDWLGMAGDDDERVAGRYRELPDLRLIELAKDYADLTEAAKTALRAEFARRELAWPEVAQKARVLFVSMSNRRLLAAARKYEQMGEEEQAELRKEFDARGLEPPVIEEEEPDGEEDGVEMEGAEAEGADSDADEFVTVRAYRDLPDAIVARGALEQAGIPCVLRDEHTVGIYWGYSNLIGGVRLQVLASDLEAAQAVLLQPIPSAFATDGGEYTQPVCPKCGSLDVMSDDMDRKLKLTGTLVGGLPMVACLPALAFVTKGAWKCTNCGCRWVDDGEPTDDSNANDGVR